MRRILCLGIALTCGCWAFTLLIERGCNLGGLTGCAQILWTLCHVPISFTSITANALLLIMVKRRYGTRTALTGIVTMTLFSIGIDCFLSIPAPEILNTPFMLPVIAVIGGMSIGLLIKEGGSTGGSDFLAMLVSEKVKLPLGVTAAIINISVVLLSSILFKSSDLVRSLLATLIVCLSIDLSIGETPEFVKWLKRHIYVFPLPDDAEAGTC